MDAFSPFHFNVCPALGLSFFFFQVCRYGPSLLGELVWIFRVGLQSRLYGNFIIFHYNKPRYRNFPFFITSPRVG